MKAFEILRQISKVYGEKLSEIEWYGNGLDMLKMAAQMFLMRNEVGGRRPSFITENVVEKVAGKVNDNKHFTISSLSDKFPQVLKSFFYDIVIKHTIYRRWCSLGWNNWITPRTVQI